MTRSESVRCDRCGAPLEAATACRYCNTVSPKARDEAAAAAGEFGLRSHGTFWTMIAVVTVAEVATGLWLDFGRYHEGAAVREEHCWALMFGAIPALAFVCSAIWRPHRGKWASCVFLALPAAIVLSVQYATTPMSGDDVGFAAALLGSLLVYYALGGALHAWIRSVRTASISAGATTNEG